MSQCVCDSHASNMLECCQPHCRAPQGCVSLVVFSSVQVGCGIKLRLVGWVGEPYKHALHNAS